MRGVRVLRGSAGIGVVIKHVGVQEKDVFSPT